MERSQAIALVRETFTQKFDADRFVHFIRNLVNHLDESKRLQFSGNYIKRAFAEQVGHYLRLGTYSDPRGERVDVLIIHLRRETTLARGRVTLRNFVADYLTTGHGRDKAAVIAAFVSPVEEDWRFSFVKLDYSLETTETGQVTERAELTPARRYSYLVGSNENCHTAQKQFLDLLQTDHSDPTIAAIEATFSVEKVTKEFFEQYHALFERSRDALKVFLKSAPTIAGEFDQRGITADDFAKKLLGQIVFLYFLQKKGWFGVERGDPWGSGRKDFIRHLFRHRADYSHTPGGGKRPLNFFNDILEPLFYEALASPRVDDDHYYSRFDCRIPFLNGGLFEPLYGYRWVETDILLPDTLFSNDEPFGESEVGNGILDVFDRYNFTVNEAEPLEKEVAVDPEMLGKVFENLLPENIRHTSGTYYTPRVIVHYMCQESLLHYLATRAPEIDRDELALFLRLAERFADFEATETKKHADKRLPETVAHNAAHLDHLLATVTVCDPAIGSGAFPVGMMHEIVRARMALTPVLEKVELALTSSAVGSRSPYALKRHTIQQSLYGVDEDPGAVEIAKLRLWLSMVVDEDHIGIIQPLPNLDYKIMQGNSLLEEFDGISLFDERLLQKEENDFSGQRLAQIEEKQRWVQKEMLRLQAAGQLSRKMTAELKESAARLAKERKALLSPPEPIDRKQPDLGLGSRGGLKRIRQLHAEFFDESSRAKKARLRDELERLEWDFMLATLREQGREHALVELERASVKHRKPFFLWRLHFAEVFQEKGGFDVVIANPPYVRIQELAKDIVERLKILYSTAATGNYDLYVVYSELGLRLLADHGVVAFIQPHKFFNSNYGKGLRKALAGGQHVKNIVYFGDHQVFEGTTNYVCLLFLTKQPNPSFRYVKVEDLQHWYATTEGLEGRFPADKLTEENWSIVVGRGGNLHDQLAEIPRKLEDVTSRIFQGLKTSSDKIYIVERLAQEGRNVRILCREDEREYVLEPDLLHPLIKGGDSKAYSLQTTERLILFPYAPDESGKVELIPAESLRDDYPLTSKYLHGHEQYLRGRERGRMDHNGWYGYGRNQALDVMSLPKIFTPDIAPRASYSLDPTGECFFTGGAAGGYGILPKEGESYTFLLGLLNSNVLDWFLHNTTTPMRGGWFSYESRYIRHLPIPDADVSQQNAIEHLVEYLLFLNGHSENHGSNGSSKRTLQAGYFEQWVNAMVYELFFAKAVHSAGLYFFSLFEAANLPRLSAIRETDSVFENIFEELYRPGGELRQGLFAIDSLEEIRIIEGKA